MAGDQGVRESSSDLTRAIRTRTAPLLSIVLGASLTVIAATSGLAWFRRSETQVSWWPYWGGAACTVVAFGLNRSGRSREAGIVLTMGMWSIATIGVFTMGGPASPAVFLEFPVILTAALFWSWRASAVLSAATACAVFVAAWVLTTGHPLVPPPKDPPLAMASVFVGSLAMASVLTGAVMRSLRGAVDEATKRARRLEVMFRESPDAIAVLDDTGIVRSVNPAALALARFSREEVVGRHFASLPVFPGREGALAIRRFSALLRGGPRAAFKLHLVRRDGTEVFSEARSRIFVGDDGGRSIQVTLRDVTQRKLAEHRRSEVERRLLQLQRFETIGRVSGAVAHDVNNLLSVIALVASSLRDRLGPEERQQTDELFESAMRAAKLNRRLLSLGRQDDDVHRGPVDVNTVIEGMRRLLTRIAGASLELVVRLDHEPCIVRADTAQLEQVIINLVTNARDAMPNDGRLTIETSHSARPSPESPDAESVVVRVSDTGVGMDEGTLRRIFEPFFTTKGTSGTGLGLAAVRDIVTTYGGAVSVESRPGAGTRFEVLIPAAS